MILWRTLDGAITIGDLGFLAGSLLRLRSLLEGLLLGFSQLASQAVYLDDLFSFFDIVPAIRSPGHPVAFPVPIRSGIRFENVGFRYQDAERWAVHHLDLEIRAGEVVALVGENGAGKTPILENKRIVILVVDEEGLALSKVAFDLEDPVLKSETNRLPKSSVDPKLIDPIILTSFLFELEKQVPTRCDNLDRVAMKCRAEDRECDLRCAFDRRPVDLDAGSSTAGSGSRRSIFPAGPAPARDPGQLDARPPPREGGSSYPASDLDERSSRAP